MTDSPNLHLPEIASRQKRKYEVHNDALYLLDTLVQLAVLDRDLAAPPASLVSGQRWIVASSPTGAWAGEANNIAAWQNNVWQFSSPNVGWVAFVADESCFLIWNGTAWVDFFSALTTLQNLTRLGLGTTADSTNPFSAKLNNALWIAKTAAEGGDGNLRYKLSKENAAATLSLLFQDNYSGRAEIGLTGNDDFHFKVSPDGSAWYDALVLAQAGGQARMLSLSVAGGLNVGAASGVNLNAAAPPTPLAGTALQIAQADGAVSRMELIGYGNSGVNIQYSGRRSGGTAAAPSATPSGQTLSGFAGFGYGTTGWSTAGSASFSFVTSEAHTDTAKGAEIRFFTVPNGTTANGIRWTIDNAGNFIGTSSTAATSTTTGAITTPGGIGAQGDIYSANHSVATAYKVGSTQVVGARDTGWSAWTGTGSKASKAVSTATTADNAAAIKSILDVLIAHGLIGA